MKIWIVALIAALIISYQLVHATVAGGVPSLSLTWEASVSDRGGFVAVSNNGSIVVAAFSGSINDVVKFFDKEGNQIGYYSLSGSPIGVSLSYDGARAAVGDGNYIHIYDYDPGPHRFVNSKNISAGDSVLLGMPREDPVIVAYVIQRSYGNPELHIYDIAQDQDQSVTISNGGSITTLAIADSMYKDAFFIVAVGDDEGYVHLLTYDGTGINQLDSIYMGSYTKVVSIDLSRHGYFMAVLYENTQSGDYYVAAYQVTGTGASEIGTSVNVGSSGSEVAMQTNDEDADYLILIAGSGDAVVLNASAASDSLTTITSFGYPYADDDLTDISFYGSYVVAGTTYSSGNIYLVDVYADQSDSVADNYLTDTDMSEDASVLVVGDTNGNLRYYQTGVFEDAPVPVPEPFALILASVTSLVLIYIILGKLGQ